MNDYQEKPLTVAATLLAGSPGWTGDATLSSRKPLTGEPLFRLSRIDEESLLLESVLGTHRLAREEVSTAEPDPLWASVDGICEHMEQDHHDTFMEFLGLREDGCIAMPWVERGGFFLCYRGQPNWIPFPQDCPTANHVRKALITMLREIRK